MRYTDKPIEPYLPFYIASRLWRLSLNEHRYEELLCEDAEDLVEAFQDVFNDNEFCLLAPLVSNSLKKRWVGRPPFMVSKGCKDKLLSYLWLQKSFSLPGPTNLIFRLVEYPCFVLVLKRSQQLTVDTSIDYSGLPVVTIGVPPVTPHSSSDHLIKYRNAHFDVHRSLKLSQSKRLSPADSQESCQLIRVKDFIPFDGALQESLPLDDPNYQSFCDLLEQEAIGNKGVLMDIFACFISQSQLDRAENDEINEVDEVVQLQKMVSLLQTWFHDAEDEKDTIYLFNSTPLRVEDGLRDGDRDGIGSGQIPRNERGGGCLKVVGAISPRNYSDYYFLSALISVKLAESQKWFDKYKVAAAEREARQHALKAAIAAVMTRNGSHNLGSHALGHIATYFDAAERKNDGYEDNIGKFLRYIQKRMDFMTQIATAPPTWCLNLPWIDGLYSFKNDLINSVPVAKESKAEEEKSASEPSYAVLSDFQNQFCLLDTIVQSDNVRRAPTTDTGKSQLLFDVSINPTLIMLAEDGGEHAAISGSTVFVAIPHGQIGAHALYSILENLLRNAAKYGGKVNSLNIEPLKISVTLREKWESPSKFCDNWKNEYFQLTISDNGGKATPEIVEQINGYLREDILDRETAELLTGQWGIKEIKICAAYLRMVRQEQIDSKFIAWSDEEVGEQPPIAEARLINQLEETKYLPDKEQNWEVDANGKRTRIKERERETKTFGNLAYVFYLLQPKEAFILNSPQDDALNKAQKLQFQRAGFDFRSFYDLQFRVRSGGQPLRHQFGVLNAQVLNNADWKWLANNIDALPSRVFACGAVDVSILPEEAREILGKVAIFCPEMPEFATPKEWRLWLWQTWVMTRTPGMETTVRWDIASSANVQDVVTFVDQDDAATSNIPRPGSLVFDHWDNPHIGRKELYQSSEFHESIGGSHPAREIFKSVERQLKMKEQGQLETDTLVFLMQLREAAAAKIAVMDERIFDRRDDLSAGGASRALEGQTFEDSWEKRRLYLLDHNEAAHRFTEFGLKGLDEGEIYDVLVVHQGILDKLAKLPHEIYQVGWQRLKARARFVVVDTGRGKPEVSRAENLRWLEYSNLSEAVFRGTKLDVVSLLFALRAESEIGGKEDTKATYSRRYQSK